MLSRWLTETPPFYPLVNNFIVDRKLPIYIDTSNLMSVYHGCPHLRAVIDKHAEMTRNMRLKLVKIATGEEVKTHEILTLLKKPNPLQYQGDFFAQMDIYEQIYADAFVYKLKPAFAKAKPKVLWNLPAGELKVNPTGKLFGQTKLEDIVLNYEFISSFNEEVKKFAVQDVIHMAQGVSDDYLTGKSKILTLRMQISNIDGALKTRNVLINEKGALGIISNKTNDVQGGVPLGDEERTRIEKDYRMNKYGLDQDQMKWIITTANVSWTPMGYPTKDLMLFEEIEDDFTAICNEYGIDRNIFPDAKGTTFANKNEAIKSTYQNTIIPSSEAKIERINNDPDFDLIGQGLMLVADFSHVAILQEDKKEKEMVAKTKAERLSLMLRDGVITKEEYALQMGNKYNPQLDEMAQADQIRNAQVQLRGTVGGTTGIVALNQAVSIGDMDRNAAVAVLVNQFGYDQAIAELMITRTIKPPPPPPAGPN